MTIASDQLAHGWRLHQAGNWSAAEASYVRALQADPNDANAWCYLGMVCHDQERLDEAVMAYRRALQIRPGFPVALNNLGNTFRRQRRFAESLASFDEALRLQPDYVNAHKNKGTLFFWEGHLQEALACYQTALRFAPDDAETHKNVGILLLLLGNWSDGWPEYRWRWKTDGLSLPSLEQPLWDGSSLSGRTILLVAEQGLGDTVLFVRYARILKERFNCRVFLACPRSLLPLLQSCPGIDVLVAQGETPPPFDVYAPLLDMPGILRDTPDTVPAKIPYLAADPNLVEQWKSRLSGYSGFRIGVVWQGGRRFAADFLRSFALAELAPLGRLTGAQLFSLQKGDGVEQLDTLAGCFDIVPLGDELDAGGRAFMDTAAVLKNLDLLITADTATAHVAGALGVPVWLALAHVPDWRWLLDREDSVWYPSVRLFRQTKPHDWPSVFERMADELLRQSPAVARRRARDYRLATSGPNRLARTRHGLMLYNRHDKYIGRSLERYGEFSEGECDLFRQVVRSGDVVVEAGANIGAHTLQLARLVGDRGVVYAFEPQRVLFQMLCGNMALNGMLNVVCRCEALGHTPGTIRVPRLDYHRENNFGGLSLGESPSGEEVPVTTIDHLNLLRCNFLKVDVEGMELSVFKGAQQTLEKLRPAVYVENDRPDRSAPLIAHLLALDYQLYWHLPPLFRPDNYFRDAENEFGSIVSANMLGVHSSVKSAITGLRPICSPDSDWRKP